MKSLSNIEKSKFCKNEYIGYKDGVWRILRSNSSYGNWRATNTTNPNLQLWAWTLEEMSKKLESCAYEE